MATVTTCVKSNCTIPDALVVKNVSSTACGVPVRDEGTHYNIVSVTLGVISGATIIMRLGFKLFVAKTGLGLDDWFILATILVGVPSSVLTSEGLVPNGLGRDIWTLKPQQITNVSEALANSSPRNEVYLVFLFFYDSSRHTTSEPSVPSESLTMREWCSATVRLTR